MMKSTASRRCWGIIEKDSGNLLSVALSYIDALRCAAAWKNTHVFIVKEIEWRRWGAKNNLIPDSQLLGHTLGLMGPVIAELPESERLKFTMEIVHHASERLCELTGTSMEEVAEEFQRLTEGGER